MCFLYNITNSVMSQFNAQWVTSEDAFFTTKLTNMFVNTEKNFIRLQYLNSETGERATKKLHIQSHLTIVDAFLNKLLNGLHICVIVKHPTIEGCILICYDAFEINKFGLVINIDIDYIKLTMRGKNRTLAILFFTTKQTITDDMTTSLEVKAVDTDLPLVPFRVIRIQNPKLFFYTNLMRNVNTITDKVTEDDLRKTIDSFLKNLGSTLKTALTNGSMGLGFTFDAASINGSLPLGGFLESMQLKF